MGFSAWSMGLSDMVLPLDGPPGEASAASSNLWVSMGSGIHGGQRERRQVWGLEGEIYIREGGRQLCAWLGCGEEQRAEVLERALPFQQDLRNEDAAAGHKVRKGKGAAPALPTALGA